MKNVVVLGASHKKDRYSNMAMNMLKEKGHKAFPVNPAYDEIDGVKCFHSLDEIDEQIHTVSVYMNSSRSESLIDGLIRLHPDRVILNPGSESEVLESKMDEQGIQVLKACTLVMLSTGQF